MSGAPAGRTSVLVEGFAFLEGPRWHDGQIWASDMYGHAIHRIDPHGRVENVATMPHRPCGLGWLPDGRLLAVSQADRKIVRLDGDSLVVHADLSGLTQFALNDMWVDDDGRAYVGAMGLDLEAFLGAHLPTVLEQGLDALGDVDIPSASLYRVEPDGTVVEVADGLNLPNGIVVTPDRRRVVVAETLGLCLSWFDLADGGLTNRTLTPIGFLPDGVSAEDAEGCVWVADPFGCTAHRVTPDGRVVEQVSSDQMITACALGGSAGDTLALCTTPTLAAEDAVRLRQSRLETARVVVPVAS